MIIKKGVRGLISIDNTKIMKAIPSYLRVGARGDPPPLGRSSPLWLNGLLKCQVHCEKEYSLLLYKSFYLYLVYWYLN